MRALSKSTFVLVTVPALMAAALSGLAGYAYGVHSAQPRNAVPERTVAAAPPQQPPAAGSGVLELAPSWTRWPQLTDF